MRVEEGTYIEFRIVCFETPASRRNVILQSFQEVDWSFLFDSLSKLDMFRDVSEVSETLESELSSFDSLESNVFGKFSIWSRFIAFSWNDGTQSVNSSNSEAKSVKFSDITFSVSFSNHI